ncbi:MAG: UDP-3-O-(3-hydroxymyristoyl)glucosamine N-acyltransferase [Deferribacterales bacterium]
MKSSEIASKLGLTLKGADAEVLKVCSYEDIQKGAIVPLFDKNIPEDVYGSDASVFLMKTGSEPDNGRTYLLADDAETALVSVINLLYPKKSAPAGVHPSAFVADSAELGEGVSIGAFAYIGENAVIGSGSVIHNNVSIADGVVLGKDCEIFPNVSIYSGTRTGDRVMIHSGTVIGADGFGYYFKKGVHVKIPHIGGVYLGNDVEIGSNTCVDRGKFSDTVLGDGTKIDNQVQIAHNCVLGRGCIMAGHAALAGSTTMGDYVIMGARAGSAGHVKICSETILAAQCGVISDIEKPGIYAGAPHTARKSWMREQVLIRKLPDFVKRIEDIERKLKDADGH